MAHWADRIDGYLGRLLFRAFGLLCAVIAMATAYGAWNHFSAGRPYGWTPVLLFALAAVAAAGCVPFCFSRRRRFVEALDAMEDGVADRPVRRR